MKYFLALIFIILVFMYIFSYLIMNKSTKRRYAFYLSEIFFICSGFLLSILFTGIQDYDFVNYMRTFALILMTIIAFTVSIQFRNRQIKRIPRIFPIISAIAIISFSLILFVIFSIIMDANILYLIFFIALSGISYTFINVKKSSHMNKFIYTGLITPIIYVGAGFIVLIISMINSHIPFNNSIFLFVLIFIITSMLAKYLAQILRISEWIIFILATSLILTSVSMHYMILPMFTAFILGYIITNGSFAYADKFEKTFINSEKPAFFLLLFIAGTFLHFDIYTIIIFLIFLLFKIMIFIPFFGTIFKDYKKSFSTIGISGFEFIICFSLFLMNIISSEMLTGFIIFMLISQLIQFGVIYGYDNK